MASFLMRFLHSIFQVPQELLQQVCGSKKSSQKRNNDPKFLRKKDIIHCAHSQK